MTRGASSLDQHDGGAAQHLELLPAGRSLRLGARHLVLDVAVAVVVLALAVPITRAPMSGDYGQWLMVSRFYSGESVPGYRDISAVAPAVPGALGLIRAVVGDPIVALNTVRVLLLALLAAGFYLAAGAIFGSRAAGLLAVIFAFALTDRYLELFAFGGLLQLASLAFMLLGVAALGQAAGSRHGEQTWWVFGAGAMAFAIFSHAGSVVVVVPITLLIGAVILARNWKRRAPGQWLRFLAPAAILPAAAMAYWLFVLVPANQGYTENPASLGFRGPERLFDSFAANQYTPWLIVLGFASIAHGLIREILSRRPGGYLLVASWTLASWGLLGLAIAAAVPTDYPRFAGPLLAPLAIGAAGGISSAARWLTATFAPEATEMGRTNAVLAIAGLMMLASGRDEMAAFRIHANSYGVPDLVAIEEVADWIETNLPEDGEIVALEPRDAKWIEGLTGRATLFSNKTRYSFRSYEWDRSAAADALVRSTTSMVNGLVAAKFIDVAPGVQEPVPRELLVSVNHEGEWADLLRLPESRARVVYADDRGVAEVTLSALDPLQVERFERDGVIVVRTTRSGSRLGLDLMWTRTVSISVDSPVIDVVDEFTGAALLEEVQLDVEPFDGARRPMWQTSSEGPIATFPILGRSAPVVEMRIVEGNIRAEVSADRHGLLLVADDPTRIHVQYVAATTAGPISTLALLYPPQLVADYQVSAALLRKDDAFESRLRRLAALGFVPVFESGDYAVLLHEDAQLPPSP